jgi:protease IV
MTMTTDQIMDRRRLRRKLSFWRIASFIVLAALILALAGLSGAFERLSKRGSEQIARVDISGFIADDRKMVELFKDLGEKDNVKAVVLDISSPGGSTVGGEALYEAVRGLAQKKPVVTTVGTLAASAGYMIACAADHIVARRSSLVGSIGVFIQYGDVVPLLDKVGVNMQIARSSPLKGEPSPFTPSTEEAKRMLERVVDDSYEWFVGLVADRRDMNEARARQLADGSVYTGSQGVANGLVDEIGDEETARKWLVSERGISDDLELIEWKPNKAEGTRISLFSATRAEMLRLIGAAFGLELESELREMFEKRLFLDGLTSLMQT